MSQKIYKLFAILLIVASAITGWYWMAYQQFLKTPLLNEDAVLFKVRSGDSLHAIIEDLQQQQILDQPFFFKLYVRLQKQSQKIQAGEYLIQPDYRPADLLKMFTSGAVTQYRLTLVEGWNFRQILQYLQSSRLNDSDLKNLIEGKTRLSVMLQGKKYPPEGFIFPDTYYFVEGTGSLDFLQRTITRMKKILLLEWSQRAQNLPLKSAYEALILASMVEKESGRKSEHQKIAGVFIRRLRKGMRLQSDPTIIYGMGERYQGNIRRRDIREKTAYNTYQIDGLPPTPIASPGRNAIHAVMHPDNGKSLYFVADGRGGHVFSETLEQHNRAVRKYILKK